MYVVECMNIGSKQESVAHPVVDLFHMRNYVSGLKQLHDRTVRHCASAVVGGKQALAKL